MELSTTIDPALDHRVLNMQWGPGVHRNVVDEAAKSPFFENGFPSGRRIETALGSRMSSSERVRIENNADILQFRTARPTAKGYFMKGHMILFQLARANWSNTVLNLAGISETPVHTVLSPITGAGMTKLRRQSINGTWAVIQGTDYHAPSEYLVIRMLAAEGNLLQAYPEAAVSVVDTVHWPAIRTTVYVPTGVQEFQNITNALPQADTVLGVMRKITDHHGLNDDHHSAAVEAAALCGATWILKP